MKIGAPVTNNVWLFATESETQPQLLTGQESSDLPADAERAAAGSALRIEQDGHPILLHLRSSTAGAAWVVQKPGERWHLLLKLAPPEAAERAATLSVLRAKDDQPDAWQQLVAEEMK